MTARERRNQLEAGLFVDTEFLIFGSFREDADDGGFEATRWLPATELEGVETSRETSGVGAAVSMLDELVDGLKSALELDD